MSEVNREAQETVTPEEVIFIILDSQPSKDSCKHPMVKACGEWNSDQWIWNKDRLAQFNVHDLVKIYRAANWRMGDE